MGNLYLYTPVIWKEELLCPCLDITTSKELRLDGKRSYSTQQLSAAGELVPSTTRPFGQFTLTQRSTKFHRDIIDLYYRETDRVFNILDGGE